MQDRDPHYLHQNKPTQSVKTRRLSKALSSSQNVHNAAYNKQSWDLLPTQAGIHHHTNGQETIDLTVGKSFGPISKITRSANGKKIKVVSVMLQIFLSFTFNYE